MRRVDDASATALAGTQLEPPLRQLLKVELDEWAVLRLWAGIQERTAAKAARARQPWRNPLALWLSFSLALALAVDLRLWFHPDHDLGAHAKSAAGVLLTRDAQHFESLEAKADGPPARVEFADGSSIEAATGTRVEGLAATPNEFVVLLRRGHARFSVTPGGPRRWLIETRNARVEVVGTVLSVESSDAGARVHVEEGTVLVRSPLLPDGVERVRAGQSLSIAAPSDVKPAAASSPAEQLDRAGLDPEALDARSLDGLESRAEHRASHPERPHPLRAAELWERADEARRRRNAPLAAVLLERLLREYPNDSQAALGAFTLGVLQLDQLDRPALAAQRFRLALKLGINPRLRGSCYLRWARALQRAGDVAGARSVVSEYVEHYPRGAERLALEQLLESMP
jgi:hypothetical protein